MSKIILTEKQLDRLLLKEYLDNSYMFPLLSYLRETDEERGSELVYQYPSYFKDFDDENWSGNEDNDIGAMELYWRCLRGDEGENEDLKTNLFANDKDYLNQLKSYSFDDFPELLERYYPQTFKEYGKYLVDGFKFEKFSNSDDTTWTSMEFIGIVKNKWLIHFSDDAREIAADGFTEGTDDMDRLALTYGVRKKYEGYNFAYDLDEFEKYGHGCHNGGYKYGSDAVLFRASGIKVWHYGDEENQVIFYGPLAHDFIYVHFDNYYYDEHNEEYDERWVVYDKNGKELYSNESLQNVTDWFTKNKRQYMRKLGLKEY